MCIAAILAKCIETGDQGRLQFLLDNAIGKIPVSIESEEDRLAREEVERLSDAELVTLIKSKLPELEAKKE